MSAEALHIVNVFAPKRSGHHMVMNWLQACFEDSGVGLTQVNDVYDAHVSLPGATPVVMSAEEVLGLAGSAEAVAVNYEDVPYGNRWNIPAYSGLRERALRTGGLVTDAIVLRDFYTLWASRIKRVANAAAAGGQTVIASMAPPAVNRMWGEMAELTRRDREGQSPICIRYNDIVSNRGDHRRVIAARFGTKLSERGLDQVPGNGEGSSFSHQDFNGRGSQMNVLGRWRDLSPALVPTFLANTEDPVMDSLNREIFGFGRADVLAELPQAG